VGASCIVFGESVCFRPNTEPEIELNITVYFRNLPSLTCLDLKEVGYWVIGNSGGAELAMGEAKLLAFSARA
jgi:hypothetical protein